MKLNLTYLIDKYIGELILVPFDWLESLSSLTSASPKIDSPRTVVVAKFLGLGSIVHVLPLLQKIRETYPACRIVFLSFRENAPFLSLLKLVDETVLIRHSNPFVFAWDIFRSALSLRKMRLDFVLDLEFYSRFSAIMGFLSGAKAHVGFHAISFPRRGRLLSHHIRLDYQRHISSSFLAFFDAISFPIGEDKIVKSMSRDALLPDPQETVGLSPQDENEWNVVKSKLGISGDYIVLSPTASALWFELKEWPDKHWQALAVLLKEKTGLSCVSVGSPKDKDMLNRIFGDLAYNSAGLVSFSGYLALLQGASLVVAIESGPAYLADLLQSPVIALFGPGPARFEGVRGPRAKNMSIGLSCSPCSQALEFKRMDCLDNLCMKGITPEWVAKEAINLIQRNSMVTKNQPHLTEVGH